MDTRTTATMSSSEKPRKPYSRMSEEEKNEYWRRIVEANEDAMDEALDRFLQAKQAKEAKEAQQKQGP